MNSFFSTLLITLVVIIAIGLAYIVSKTWQDKARLTLALAILPAYEGLSFYSKDIWDSLFSKNPIIEYGFGAALDLILLLFAILFTIVSIVAWKKDGFSNLNRHPKDGILSGCVNGLKWGSMVLLLLGAIFGFKIGLEITLMFIFCYVVITGGINEFWNSSK